MAPRNSNRTRLRATFYTALQSSVKRKSFNHTKQTLLAVLAYNVYLTDTWYKNSHFFVIARYRYAS